MNLQQSSPTGAADQAARDAAREPKRYVYIVFRGGNAQSDAIFSAMRRDMVSASVELLYDRRNGERRSQEDAGADQDRRRSDRRRRDAAKEAGAAGWVRVQVE